MVRQYFLLVYRTIRRNKLYFGLIALALTIGFSSFILLSGYFTYEQSFDKFHPKLQNLYRINFELYKEGKLNVVNATSCAPVGPTLFNQLPQVKAFTRLYPRNDGVTIKQNDQDRWFSENAMYHADSGIFEVFRIEHGSLGELKKPFTALISRSTAIKLFGNENPQGEKLTVSENEVYEIEGVFNDFPQNSHIEINILLSFSTLELLDWSKEGIREDWAWYSFYNYVLLDGDYRLADLNKQIEAITSVYTKPIDERINGALRYTLFPFSKIYLQSDVMGEMDKKGNLIAVQVVTIVAILILIMSLVNYFNLMTSWIKERSQEITIRVILGTTKQNIFFQSLTEISTHLIVIGTIAILFAYGFWNPFCQLIEYALPFNEVFSLAHIGLYYALIFLLSLLLSCYYTFNNTFIPDKLIKNKAQGNKGITFSKAIVTFQFFCAISIIIAALSMNRQISFMEQVSPGFESKKILFLKLRRIDSDHQFYQNLKSIKQDLEKLSWVSRATSSSLVPGQAIGWTSGGKVMNQETTTKIHNYGIDHEFVSAYQISLLAGRNFSTSEENSAVSVLVNEEAMKAFGFSDPKEAVGKIYLRGGDENQQFQIIGVVRNFHQRGLQHKLEPIVFHYLPNDSYYSGPAFISIKLTDEEHLGSRLKAVEEIFQKYFPGRPLESDMLFDFYYKQYQKEKNILKTLGVFSVLIITISSLGLIGLISFSALKRAKEIGVRKVLGASVIQIQFLIGREFLVMMLVATIISIPVCFNLLNQWLSTFEFKINLSAWPFLLGSTVIIFVSTVVISLFIWKHATVNPVESLKSDG